VALPIDRGYVIITDLGDGTQRVDIYARKAAAGPTHLFASHTGVAEVVLAGKTEFATYGKSRVSGEPVQVTYSEKENRIYILDVASVSAVLG